MTFAIWKAEYDVRNGEATNSYADRPTIAYLPNGGYVVGWRENNQLKFKVYNGAGESQKTPQGLDIVYSVDAETAQGNNLEIQAIGTDGNFVVSWNSGNVNAAELKTRVFSHNGDGNYTGGTIYTQQTNTSNASEVVSVSANMDGGFISVRTDGREVIFAKHSEDSAVIGSWGVFTGAQGSIDYPRATQIASNKYVVSYGNGDNINFRIVTVTGDNAAITTPVNLGTGIANKSQVVALKDANGVPDGRFAVVYNDAAYLYARFYDANGAPIGDQARIELTGDGWNAGYFFDVTAVRGGRIAVTYAGDAAINGNIVLKVFDINGKGSDGLNGPDTLFLDQTDNQYTPTITEMTDGRLAVAWEDPTRGQTDVSSVIVDPRLTKVDVSGTARNDYYVGSEYDGDKLQGNGGNDTLLGGNGADILEGGADNDSLVGGDGDDHLNGAAGADALNGGNGLDTASYWNADAAIGVYLHSLKDNTGHAAGDTYTSIEVVAGSYYDDTIEGAKIGSGSTVNDIFFGDRGNDLLKGFIGDDTLQGSTGADTLYGGLGSDSLNGGIDTDGTQGSERDLASYLDSTAGSGIVANLDDATQNRGVEAAGDTYYGIDDLAGTNWGDFLLGQHADRNGASLRNKLFGHGGNDTLDGGWGADTLDGGEDYNFASYTRATNIGVIAYLDQPGNNGGEAEGDVYINIQGLIGSSYDDTLYGSNFTGSLGNNELRGGAGADALWGQNGDDTLEGGAGADSLDGGGSFDFASYANADKGVYVSLNASERPAYTNDAAGDQFIGIEGLIGSAAYGDTLVGDGGDNTLRGLGGNDALRGGEGADRMEGGAGNDTLYGDAGADALDGGSEIDTVLYSLATGAVTINLASGRGAGSDAEGDTYSSIENAVGSNSGDVFVGNGAANSFMGLGGNDTYYISAGDSVAESAGGGHDKVVVDASYALDANIEDLEGTGGGALALTGNALNNTITGNAAGNWIDGGIGADTMAGGAGDDTYVIDNAGDRIVDDIGVNSVILTVSYDMSLLPSSVRNVTMTEGLALDLTGTNGANVLMGNVAANTLSGLGGNDTIYGKGGNDKLYGGAGKDVFVFDTALHKTRNVDRIYDFKSKDDSFHLDNQYFTKLGKGMPTKPVKFKADMFVEGKKAQDREDRIVYDKKTGSLYYDKDGTGGSAQVKIATINNKTKLAYHDFFVI